MQPQTATSQIRPTSKVCTKCGGLKSLTHFHKKLNAHQPLCKPCKKVAAKAWYTDNIESRKAYEDARRKAQPSRSKIHAASWREANPTKVAVINLRKKHAYQIETYGRTIEPIEMFNDRFRAARALGYRSGLEVQISRQLEAAGVPFMYEGTTLRYNVPAEDHRYTPDYILPNYIVIEAKGQFTSDDRKKIKLVREQHPNIDLRFVFSRSSTLIGKKSKTTYGDWCAKLGIKYANKVIPEPWLKEPRNEASRVAIEAARHAG